MSVNNEPKPLDPTSLNFGGAIDEQEAPELKNENCLCVFTNRVLKGTVDHSRALCGRVTVIDALRQLQYNATLYIQSPDDAVQTTAKKGSVSDLEWALAKGGKLQDNLACSLAWSNPSRDLSRDFLKKLELVVRHGGNLKIGTWTAADYLVENYKWNICAASEDEHLHALKTVIEEGRLTTNDLQDCIALRAMEHRFWSGFLYLTNEVGVTTYLRQRNKDYHIKHVPENHPQRDLIIDTINKLPEPDNNHSKTLVN